LKLEGLIRLLCFDAVGLATGRACAPNKRLLQKSKPLEMMVIVSGWGIAHCTLWATPHASFKRKCEKSFGLFHEEKKKKKFYFA